MAEIIKMKKDCALDDMQLEQLAEDLRYGLSPEFICGETVCGGSAVLLSFERYFMRNGNYAALTVLLSRETDSTGAVVIGSAGGGGLLNLSWGANRSFAEDAERILLQSGFEPVPCEEEPEEFDD